MYVEVSGRQTGKSTRMVEDIVLFLEENGGKTALVVSPTGASRKLIKEKIFQKCGYCINRVITSHKMLPPMNTMKQYVDEFFYVKEKIIYLEAGKITAMGTFNEVREKVPDFDKQSQLMGL